MKLTEILKEIELGKSKPYENLHIKDESVYYAIWEFETDSKKTDSGKIIPGKQYQVIIGKTHTENTDETEVSYIVSFGFYDKGTIDFGAEVNDIKSMYRVMATVVKAIKDTMADEINQTELPVSRIVIEPTKREIITPGSAAPVYDRSDTRRADFYMMYIEKEFKTNYPGAKVRANADKSEIIIDLPTK